jgi:hypothetical protein
MKICRNLLHLITPLALLPLAAAQLGPAQGRIVNLGLDPQTVTTLHLRPGYVSSVRLPESVSSVVLGDPGSFKAEHSEAEPQLVFFKAINPNASETNALITTRTGRAVSLTLVCGGDSDQSRSVDYVVRYEHPGSFLIEAAHSSFVIDDTKSFDRPAPGDGNVSRKRDPDEPGSLKAETVPAPHWQGKQLRVAIGQIVEQDNEMKVGFSVLNSSSKTIELLPPQIQLAGNTNGRHSRGIKAEPVGIKTYRMTSRRLAPGEKTDGVVIFERPSFKESRERLLLQVAQAEEVDRPVLTTLAFVPPAKGVAK